MKRRGGVIGWIAFATCIVGPGPVRANGAVLEEIIVTARKFDETRFEVPLSIDVVAADALPSGFSLDLARLELLSPGLHFESYWGGAGAAPVLRGQSQPSTAGDNVGVFVDGIYQAERTAIDTAPIDVERVEVVRGPQSTLFGQSTFAGAIHYVARQPTEAPAVGAEAVVGTDHYLAANAFVSGPLRPGVVLGRLAVGARESDGTAQNITGDSSLGDVERYSIAGALVSDWRGPWRARLATRWVSGTFGHPPIATIGGPDYNCGAVDAATQLWSYFCGPLPRASRFDLSPDLPDSRLDVSQAALELSWQHPGVELLSTTSYYRGSTDAVRDFDASAAGESFGVCVSPACPLGAGPPLPVNRIVPVDSVSVGRAITTEWNQEFRLRGTNASALDWMIGWTGIVTRQTAQSRFGFERGDLAPGEKLTILLPQSPALAGPVARANSLLVDNPSRQQVLQSDVTSERRTFAVFGSIDGRLGERWRLRAEARATLQYLEIEDSPIPAQKFTDTTPRFSVQYSPTSLSMLYASAAKGSRAGGVNATPGLASNEQAFDPEYNWTYELGARVAPARWNADATIFYIDWQDTQLLGFPLSQGVNGLITRNTAGVTTRGVELATQAQLHERVRLRAAYSHAASEFAIGSDDPGSSTFCGLKGSNTSSTLCRVGPSRSGNAPAGTYVPYIDGNSLPRAPEDQWGIGLEVDLTPSGRDWRLRAAVDVGYQGDVFDRAINGAQFGERTLASARIACTRGPWTVEFWSSNLTDEQYLRGVASRGPVFYPVTPRPLDLVQGEGRRLGVTLRYRP